MDMISHYGAKIPYAAQRAAAQSDTGLPEVRYAAADEYRKMIEELESRNSPAGVDEGTKLYNGSTTRAKLSDTEIAALANKYDLRNMSDSEFSDFLDDLESMGAVSAYEKTRELGCKGMAYPGVGDAENGMLAMSAWVAPAVPGGSTLLFERRDANGDVFRWINERIQWKPSYSKDPAQKKAQKDCVELHNFLAGVINRMDSQQRSSARDAEKKELVRQLADKNSDFYANMRVQLKAQVEKTKEDEEQQAIIDALGKVLDALSGKEEVPGRKESVNKSASDLTKKIGDRISKLDPRDPEQKKEIVKLKNMLKRLQEMGIYIDLSDTDDWWQDEDETFETLTQLLTRRQAEETSAPH